MPDQNNNQKTDELLSSTDAYSTSLESVPLDMPLPYTVFIKFGRGFLLFRNKQDILTKKRADALLKSGVDTVYIKKSDWMAYIASIEKFVEPSIDSEEYVSHIRNLLLAYGRTLESEIDVKAGVLGKIQSLAKILVDVIAVTPELADGLLKRYNDPSLYFINHNVNVAIYGLVMGLHLNLPLHQVRMLAFSALVHNVGNLYIPKEILYKEQNLSEEEFDLIKQHTLRGAKILQSIAVPEEAVIVAMQHHERDDGKGYPNGLRGKHIHLFAKVVTIADVYDALCNNRPYQKAYEPKIALKMMQEMVGKFDPRILKMVDFNPKAGASSKKKTG